MNRSSPDYKFADCASLSRIFSTAFWCLITCDIQSGEALKFRYGIIEHSFFYKVARVEYVPSVGSQVPVLGQVELQQSKQKHHKSPKQQAR